METKQQTPQPASRVSAFWFLVVFGLTWASGYWAGKSLLFMGQGFFSQANVKLGGLLISIVLVIAAIVASQKLVKSSK